MEEFSTFMEAAECSPHENISLPDVNTTLRVITYVPKNLHPFCQTLIKFQNVSQPTHIQGHTLDVLCSSKFHFSSSSHTVNDNIYDLLAVFHNSFSCQISCNVKIRNLVRLLKVHSSLTSGKSRPHTKQQVY